MNKEGMDLKPIGRSAEMEALRICWSVSRSSIPAAWSVPRSSLARTRNPSPIGGKLRYGRRQPWSSL
jgi:hypothetical protein